LESFEYQLHSIFLDPFHELQGIQLPAVARHSGVGNALALYANAFADDAVFEAGDKDVVLNALEKPRILVFVDLARLFFLVVFRSLSVVCFVGRLVGHSLEAGDIRLSHLVN